MRVVFSNRKTLVIEVRPDQTVVVRAPIKTKAHELSDFVKKNERWIQKKRHFFSTQEKIPLKSYSSLEIQHLFERLYKKCWERCKDWSYARPRLRIRKMKTRWGSLSTKTMTVTLNADLAHFPEACIEDVIMHEFCHLKYYGHGKRFYQLLDKMAPGWRDRKYVFKQPLD